MRSSRRQTKPQNSPGMSTGKHGGGRRPSLLAGGGGGALPLVGGGLARGRVLIRADHPRRAGNVVVTGGRGICFGEFVCVSGGCLDSVPGARAVLACGETGCRCAALAVCVGGWCDGGIQACY